MAEEKKEEPTESKDRIGQVLKVGDWFVHPDWSNPYQVVSFTPTGNPRSVFRFSKYHQKDILKSFRKDKVVKVPNPEGGESSYEELQTLVDAYQEDNERLTLKIIELEAKIEELKDNPLGYTAKNPSEETLKSAMRHYLTRYSPPPDTLDLSYLRSKGPEIQTSKGYLGKDHSFKDRTSEGVWFDEESFWNPETRRWVSGRKRKGWTNDHS